MDLHSCTHREQLVPREETILSIDYKQNGLGNASCGGEAMPQYRLNPESVSFCF
jgi:hypothetical protein